MRVRVAGSKVENWILDLTKDFCKWYIKTYMAGLDGHVYVKLEPIAKDAPFHFCGEVAAPYASEPKYTLTFYCEKGVDAKNIVMTLAHEMTHVKQYASGDLSTMENVYRGEYYDPEVLDYFELPWEFEANGMERACLYRFARESNAVEALIKSRYD